MASQSLRAACGVALLLFLQAEEEAGAGVCRVELHGGAEGFLGFGRDHAAGGAGEGFAVGRERFGILRGELRGLRVGGGGAGIVVGAEFRPAKHAPAFDIVRARRRGASAGL